MAALGIIASIFDKTILQMISLLVVAGAIYFLKPFVENFFRRRNEIFAFRSQCEDTQRHFRANTDVIKNLISDRKTKCFEFILRDIHIKRLCLLPGMADFDLELYRCLKYRDVKVIEQHKLLMRNIEIDIKEALEIYAYEDGEALYDFLGYLIERFDSACANIERTLKGEDFQAMPIKIAYKRAYSKASGKF